MRSTALPHSLPAAGSVRSRVDRVLDNGLYVVTAGLFVLFSLTIPFFFSAGNIINMLDAAAIKGMLAAGFAVALIGGLIDTSIAGVVAVGTVLTGLLWQQLGFSLPMTILLVLCSGVVMGLANSVMVVDARINAFIATLATGAVFFAICLALTNGQTIVITRPGLREALLVRPLGLPLNVWIMVAWYLGLYALLHHTRLGAHLFAVGSNYQAARLAGVPVGRVIRSGLVIVALSASLTALLATTRAGQTLLYGTTLGGFALTDTLTAVLLGGVSLFGGAGSIWRILVAVLFLTILATGLQLMQTSTGWWFMIQGAALVAAVILDVVRRRRD